jgi:ribonuclease III family protein
MLNNADNKANELNALTLAYIGDAVIELFVRKQLIYQGYVKPNALHKECIRYVSAKGQASFLFNLLNEAGLTEEEQGIVRKGRNAKSGTVPKNTDVQTYRYGTAFECLIGYLDLKGQAARVAELLGQLMAFHSVNVDQTAAPNPYGEKQ